MFNGSVVTVQIIDVSGEVRDMLAEAVRRRRARNVTLLRELREVGGGYVGDPGEAAEELRGHTSHSSP